MKKSEVIIYIFLLFTFLFVGYEYGKNQCDMDYSIEVDGWDIHCNGEVNGTIRVSVNREEVFCVQEMIGGPSCEG